jgi:hypothetical protein
MDWLLLVIVIRGHVGPHIETLTVTRFPTEQACTAAADKVRDRFTATACYPVAKLS